MKISEIKKIRESIKATHIVIWSILEDGSQNVSSHGKMKCDAIESSNFANSLKNILKWPSDLCRSKPLDRKCNNCVFLELNNKDYSDKCCYDNAKVNRKREDIACHNFEPKC